MSSKLTPYLVIGLFAAVVFGATVVSQFDLNDKPAGVADADLIPAQPLEFARNEVRYDPESDDPGLKFFPGFYEIGPAENPASYWFRNPNPVPVGVTVLDRSCTSCSSARLSVLPSGAMAKFIANSTFGLGFGPLPVPDLAAAVAGADLLGQMQWREFDLEKKDETQIVPAAPSPENPVWGVLQLGVKVSGVGSKTLTATVGLQTPGMAAPAKVPFKVTMNGAPPFAIGPETIDAGKVDANGGPRVFDAMYWSATRGLDRLPPPKLAAPVGDPLVAIGAPVPLTDAERAAHQASMVASGVVAPMRAGYRVPVTVLPAGAGPPDIGPFERAIGVSGPEGSTARVVVKGVVTGVVELFGGQDLKLGRYNGKFGTSKTVQLVSDVAGLELETVPDETRPAFLQVALDPPKTEAGRRFWTMKVAVPPESGYGDLPPDAAAVLRVKGPNGQRVRLPVTGQAGLR